MSSARCPLCFHSKKLNNVRRETDKHSWQEHKTTQATCYEHSPRIVSLTKSGQIRYNEQSYLCGPKVHGCFCPSHHSGWHICIVIVTLCPHAVSGSYARYDRLFSHADGRHIPGFPGCLIHKLTGRKKEIKQNMEKKIWNVKMNSMKNGRNQRIKWMKWEFQQFWGCKFLKNWLQTGSPTLTLDIWTLKNGCLKSLM